jgi:hypothetical protein
MQSRNQIDEDIIRYTRYLVNKEHPTKSARASDFHRQQSAISTISNQHNQQSAQTAIS